VSAETGILHFGPGAFHRAHQAAYVDRLLAHDPRFGIAAVSLRSGATIEALARQQGRYTLAILDAEPDFRTIRAHTAWHGPGEERAVRARLADPKVRIVTSTVTERATARPRRHARRFTPRYRPDLAAPEMRAAGGPGAQPADRRVAAAAVHRFVRDNMASNGRKLGAAVRAFAEARDAELGRWIAGEARFPNVMVDSITPATDDALRRRVRDATGYDDAIPVAREAYSAWVIEDVLPPNGPDFASTGAIVTGGVEGYELAKLRILNGAHSARLSACCAAMRRWRRRWTIHGWRNSPNH
jgi:fructuronate reductase